MHFLKTRHLPVIDFVDELVDLFCLVARLPLKRDCALKRTPRKSCCDWNRNWLAFTPQHLPSIPVGETCTYFWEYAVMVIHRRNPELNIVEFTTLASCAPEQVFEELSWVKFVDRVRESRHGMIIGTYRQSLWCALYFMRSWSGIRRGERRVRRALSQGF
jgi:hypothetical protein